MTDINTHHCTHSFLRMRIDIHYNTILVSIGKDMTSNRRQSTTFSDEEDINLLTETSARKQKYKLQHMKKKFLFPRMLSEVFHRNSRIMLLQVKHHVHDDEEDYSISGELNVD
ncbi:unnamed protein product [Brassica napus]|uniref:(rape) hypothetical protein n=1 Tax=Brassica napus TaxID=3708 RepID=A0A816JPQ3_BRANA|nr:unnamed protein product [Brassica napus]